MERTINGRKIPSGTWLLEKLGLCNCCPKARCVFILIEARTLLGLSSRLLHVSDFLTDAHWMHGIQLAFDFCHCTLGVNRCTLERLHLGDS